MAVNIDAARYKWNRSISSDYGLQICEVKSLAEVWEKVLYKNNFVLILFSLKESKDLDYLHIIRNLSDVPILVLVDQYDGIEKIAVLEAGADEYIQWPDTIEEGIASARALIRRYTDLNRGSTEVVHGDSEEISSLRFEHGKAFAGEKEILFTRQEYNLFYLLATHPGQLFTNEQIYKEIWKAEYFQVSENSINSCLRRIRRKLEELPELTCSIENRKGFGYYFSCRCSLLC